MDSEQAAGMARNVHNWSHADKYTMWLEDMKIAVWGTYNIWYWAVSKKGAFTAQGTATSAYTAKVAALMAAK